MNEEGRAAFYNAFHNSSIKKELGFDDILNEIVFYVKSQPEKKYEITVGTDSAAEKKVRLVTAISILRKGNGGRYFWTKSNEMHCPTLQDRIYKEAMQSITMVQELKSRLKDELGEEFFWPSRDATQSVAGGDNKLSVHIDVGRKGPTKDLIDGVVGMVKGFGFEAVIKPDSFTAFVVADRHT
ncbi:MAG: ribonuclease H-like YkuK family protein [Patescibacteria group bacterium]